MPRRPLCLVPLLGAAVLTLSACGSPAFEPEGEAAAQARTEVAEAQEKVLDGVVGSSRVVGTATFDACSEGQSNWKVKDANRYECVLAHSRVVPGPATAAEVDRSLRSVHATLVGLGCHPLDARAGLAAVADEYWPGRRQMPDSSPGMLPSGRYGCGPTGSPDAGGAVQVEVQPYAAGRDEDLDLRPDVNLTRYAPRPVLTSEPFAAGTRAEVASSGLVLHYVVTAHATYYAVPF